MLAMKSGDALFLTGDAISPADYKAIEQELGAGFYAAPDLADGFEQLMATNFAAVVVADGFGGMNLPGIAGMIRVQHTETPIILIGNPPLFEAQSHVLRYEPLFFFHPGLPATALLKLLRDVRAMASTHRETTRELPLREWTGHRSGTPEAEKILQLTRKILRHALGIFTHGRNPEDYGAHSEGAMKLKKNLEAMTSELRPKILTGHEITDTIQESMHELSKTVPGRSRILSANFGETAFSVKMDRWAFSQVMHELILNALEHSPAGSAIRIFAGVSHNRFEFRVHNPVHAGVRDLSENTGIGLAACEFFVHNFRGQFDIRIRDTDEAQEAVVRIRLPVT